MQQAPSDNFSQIYSGVNLASDFFSNFIDRSQIESESEHQASPQQSEGETGKEFSINEGKLIDFHCQNLVHMDRTITLRTAINRWLAQKQRIKRIEQRTPHQVTKTILKVFYSLSVKLQVKYSFALRKMQRLYEEHKKSEHYREKQVKSEIKVEDNVQKSESMRNEKIEAGLKMVNILTNILTKCQKGNNINKFFTQVVRCSTKVSSISTICAILSQIQLQILQQAWSNIRGWLNFLQKAQILKGTITLFFHQQLRNSFLSLSIHRQSLQCNNISNIHEPKPRKQSYKMNNSTQSIALQKQLLDHIPVIELKQQHDSETQQNHRIVRRREETIDRNDPRLLKFSKDLKRKIVPVSQITVPEIQEQSQTMNHNSRIIESSEIKPQNQELSMMRRNSATMNTSIGHSNKSILKKIFYPIQLHEQKRYRVVTELKEDQLPLILNEGHRNKQFRNNNNNAGKSKAIKHQQLRRDFTDFNDLFSSQEIMSFYQSTRCRQEKKGISLAKIRQKVNTKTQQEYYSRLHPKSEGTKKVLVTSQSNIDHPRKVLQHTFNSIRMNNSQSRSRNTSSRKAEFRIPSELPKHFDYYLDKSAKKEQLRASAIVGEKRKSIYSSGSRSRKKLMFHVVKSGNSSRLSAEDTQRRKGQNTETQLPLRAVPSKIKIELPQRRTKQSRQIKQSLSPCEYFMFRQPPKKKMKKSMSKNVI